MKKLDNKGMSLVEVVMAILIVSIASVLLVQSLSTVTRLISEADLRTRTTNDQLNALVGSKVDEGVEVTSTEKDVVINAEGLARTINVFGDYEVATSSNGSEISLHNFTAKKNGEDIYQKMISNIQKIKEETDAMSDNNSNEERKAYFEKLELEAGKVTNVSITNGPFTNDQLRACYYLIYGFTKVKQEIIDECNDIFDEGHPNPKKKEAETKIGTREMIWKVYYTGTHDGKAGDFIVYGVVKAYPDQKDIYSDLSNDKWETFLVYNERDQSLYYKLFPPAPNDWSAPGSIIGLTAYNNSNGLLTLQTQLEDGNQWKKLKNR